MSRLKKGMASLLCLILMISIFAACSNGANSNSGEKRVIRIATVSGDGRNADIRSMYTDLYEFTNNNIEIEIVSAIDYNTTYLINRGSSNEQVDPYEEMKKLLEGPNPPDVVIVDDNEILRKLVNDNLLTSLEPQIQKDSLNLEDFVPGVIEGLRDIGNGEMYALSPTFSPSALVYNVDLFAEANAMTPTDGMTWDEVFDLGRTVSNALANGDNPKYGFAFQSYSYYDIFDTLNNYLTGTDLQIVNEDGTQMTVNTPEWREVFATMSSLKEEKVLPEQPDYSTMTGNSRYMDHNFLSGRTAMMLVNYNQLQEITTAMQLGDQIEGFTPFNWDVVTYPVHPENPDVGGRMTIYPMFAMTANAQNAEDGWDFIKFVTGEKWAGLKAKSSYNLMTRKAFIQPPAGAEGINMEAFFQLKPPSTEFSMYNHPNIPRFYEVVNVIYELIWQYQEGQLSVDDLLQQWETRGNQVLQQLKENPDGNIDIGLYGAASSATQIKIASGSGN